MGNFFGACQYVRRLCIIIIIIIIIIVAIMTVMMTDENYSRGVIFLRPFRTGMSNVFRRETNVAESIQSSSVLRFVRRVHNICEKQLLSLPCPSVRPHGTARLPLDGFSLNLIFQYFSKI